MSFRTYIWHSSKLAYGRLVSLAPNPINSLSVGCSKKHVRFYRESGFVTDIFYFPVRFTPTYIYILLSLVTILLCTINSIVSVRNKRHSKIGSWGFLNRHHALLELP